MIGLVMGRRMAETRMSDVCLVTRVTGSSWDESLGEEVDTFTTVYSGACRVRHASPNGKDVDAAGQLLTQSFLELHVPVGAPAFAPDDVVVITASATRSDQVGRRFHVVSPFDGSQTTALRYRVEVFDGR